jgi:hypothetical protein
MHRGSSRSSSKRPERLEGQALTVQERYAAGDFLRGHARGPDIAGSVGQRGSPNAARTSAEWPWTDQRSLRSLAGAHLAQASRCRTDTTTLRLSRATSARDAGRAGAVVTRAPAAPAPAPPLYRPRVIAAREKNFPTATGSHIIPIAGRGEIAAAEPLGKHARDAAPGLRDSCSGAAWLSRTALPRLALGAARRAATSSRSSGRQRAPPLRSAPRRSRADGAGPAGHRPAAHARRTESSAIPQRPPRAGRRDTRPPLAGDTRSCAD